MGELTELYDKFFAFMIDQCDKRSKSKGFSMMYDVTDAGLSNVEMVSGSCGLSDGSSLPSTSRNPGLVDCVALAICDRSKGPRTSC